MTDRERRIVAADAVIYCAGFDGDTERENHDRTFALPEGQAAEIAAVAKLNANLVVVVNSGGGVDFAQFADRARAILMAWYPGQEGGRAVAEILTGAVSPSGKLPISIERRAEDNPCYGSYYENVDRSHRKGAPQPRVNYDEGIFVGYRGYDRTATEPLYAFGYGLSYTTFAYLGLKTGAAGRRLLSGVVRREEHGPPRRRRGGAALRERPRGQRAASGEGAQRL